MNETKATHTRGPWRAEIWDYNKDNPPHKKIVIVGNEYPLATLECDFDGDNPYTIPLDEAGANAKLFAAAPGLLDACKALLLEVRQMHSHYLPLCEGDCPATGAIDKGEAAIAAAEGE